MAVRFDGRRSMNGTRPARAGLAGLALLASVGLTALPGAAVGAQTPAAASPAASPTVEETTKHDLNTSTEEEFREIPGVGDRLVREFFEYRPYASILEFRAEIGKYVDEDQVTDFETFVYVPIAPNEADAETLRQLPGVDEAIAEELITGRPYDDDEAFLAALADLVSAEEAEAAAGYLVTP